MESSTPVASTSGIKQAEQQVILVGHRTEKEKFFSFVKRMLNNVNKFYLMCCPYFWRLAELHIYKVIVFMIALYSLNWVYL
jgi:hypothetical protein